MSDDGISVNALASTPYNVAVGGTDFSDTYSRNQQHLLEFRQHLDLWLGQLLHPGNPVERLLRQPTHRDFRGFRHHLWPAGFCNSSYRVEFSEQHRE